MTGRIVAVSVSKTKGVKKPMFPGPGWWSAMAWKGMPHAGAWHRQVSLLAQESIARMQLKGLVLAPGILRKPDYFGAGSFHPPPGHQTKSRSRSGTGSNPNRQDLPSGLRHPRTGGRLRYAPGRDLYAGPGRRPGATG